MIAFVSLPHGIFVEAAKESDLERKLHLFKYRFCLQCCYGFLCLAFRLRCLALLISALLAVRRSRGVKFWVERCLFDYGSAFAQKMLSGYAYAISTRWPFTAIRHKQFLLLFHTLHTQDVLIIVPRKAGKPFQFDKMQQPGNTVYCTATSRIKASGWFCLSSDGKSNSRVEYVPRPLITGM